MPTPIIILPLDWIFVWIMWDEKPHLWSANTKIASLKVDNSKLIGTNSASQIPH